MKTQSIFFCLALTATVSAQDSFAMHIDVDSPTAGSALGLNESGVSVGIDSGLHAWLDDGTSLLDLHSLVLPSGGFRSQARCINPLGVVGINATAQFGGYDQAYSWDSLSGGSAIPLPYGPAWHGSWVNQILESGMAVGGLQGNTPGSQTACYWPDVASGVNPVPVSGIQMFTGVNPAGEMVGSTPGAFDAVHYDSNTGQLTLLPERRLGQSDFATAINAKGVVVGQSGGIAVRWLRDPSMAGGWALEALELPTGLASAATAINDAGMIGGWFTDWNGDLRGFLWDRGRSFIIDDLIAGGNDAIRMVEAVDPRGAFAGSGDRWSGGSWQRDQALVGEFTLSILEFAPGIAGATNQWRLIGGAPGTRVFAVASLNGSGRTAVPNCPGLYVDLVQPSIADRGRVGPDGGGVLEALIPTSLQGAVLYSQLVSVVSCSVSPRIEVPLR